MCVDYSQTVNKFTCLDAYPLPNMQSVIHNVTQYKWYSSLDLRSAYHQVPLLPEERKYTAFEANGQLYQSKRIPFGLKRPSSFWQNTQHRKQDAVFLSKKTQIPMLSLK